MSVKTARPLSGAEILAALGGRVQSTLLDGDIHLTAESDGSPRYFVVDHGREALDALLVVKQGDQIKLNLSAAWPRAVIVELSFAGRSPGSHQDTAQLVARAELFLAQPGVDGVVVIDRWNGAGNRALRAASAASVEMLGGITVAGPAPRYTLTVTPVQTAVAAGMMWNWDSADLPLDEVLDFDAMLRRFPPWAKVHDPPSLKAFGRMRDDLTRIVERLNETEKRLRGSQAMPALGGHRAAAAQPAYPGQIPDGDGLPAPVYPGQIIDPAGGETGGPMAAVLEMLGGFVRGDALPARTGLAFVPRTLGGARTFTFGLLVCADEAQLKAFADAAGSGPK